MEKKQIKLDLGSLVDEGYKKKCTLNHVAPDATEEEVAEFMEQLASIRKARHINEPEKQQRKPVYEFRDKPQRVNKPTGKTRDKKVKTEEELLAEKELRAIKAAEKKAIKQQYSIFDPDEIEKLPVEAIEAEIKEFFEAAPDDPNRWDMILEALAEVGLFNASPVMLVEKLLSEDLLRRLTHHIFQSGIWTGMMLTSLKHYRRFFDGVEWKKIKKSANPATCRFVVQFSPEAIAAGLTELPKKVAEKFRDMWDFLRFATIELC